MTHAEWIQGGTAMSDATLQRHRALAAKHGWNVDNLPPSVIGEQFFYAFVRGRIEDGRSADGAITDRLAALTTDPDLGDPSARADAQAELARRGINPLQWIASIK